MYVRFKTSEEPGIQYLVKNPIPITDYHELTKQYEELIEIEMIGLVPKRLLIETNHLKILVQLIWL